MGHLPAQSIVTLTTDFGLQDPYVGQLKGALLSGCPTAHIVDITHAIAPWDRVAAAITIRASFSFFPPGTVHLVVVDPGVGGSRSILAAAGGGHFFIAPDNGLLSLLLSDTIIQQVCRLDGSFFTRPAVSPTFHGRDIMAPAAVALLEKQSLTELGVPVALADLVRIAEPPFCTGQEWLPARVQHIDRFGNIRVDVRIDPHRFDPARFAYLEIGGHRLTDLKSTYADVRPGELLVLIDSSGYLEIAANQASAAALLGCSPGDAITVHCTQT